MKQALDILFVHSGYKPAFRMGGPIESIAGTAEELAARGHRIVVFTTNANLDRDLDLEVPLNEPVQVDGVEVWYFKRSELLGRFLSRSSYLASSVGFLYSRPLRDALRSCIHDFDIVHVHTPFVYPTIVAGSTALAADVPLVFGFRGAIDPHRLRYRSLKKQLFIRLVLRRLVQRASALIALTEYERRAYQQAGFSAPCYVVPNGVDPSKYHRAHNRDVLAEIGVPEDGQVILFLGRLHPLKGADLLVEAFAMICKDLPETKLVVAGPDESRIEGSFRRQVLERGLGDRVLFPGMVSGELKRSLLARADLFCLPSVAEGLSMAVLEAMASGTPVILSPGCHFPEVELEGAGVVVERDAKKWASVLDSLLRDPARLDSMGRIAYEIVWQRYSWPRVVSELEHVYREVIARRQSPEDRGVRP